MKRRIIFIAVLLSLLVSLLPTFANAEVIEDSAVNAYSFGRYPFQVKSFHANGLDWVFWRGIVGNDADIFYRTSDDNWVTASARSTLTTDPVTTSVAPSFWFDGTYAHYVYKINLNTLRYGMFTPNADGTITMVAPEQTLNYADVDYRVYICTDTNGYPWIAVSTTNYDILVWKSSTKDGTFTNDAGAGSPWTLATHAGGHNFYSPTILPLTSSQMACIYGDDLAGSSDTLRARKFTAGAWGGELQSAIWLYPEYYHATVQDDTVHIACVREGVAPDIGDIYYLQWQDNAWTDTTKLQDFDVAASRSPTITRDTTNNNLHVCWSEVHVGAPLDIYKVWYAKYFASEDSWTAPVVLIDENIDDFLPQTNEQSINFDIAPTEDNLNVYYSAGTTGLLIKNKLIISEFDVDTLEPTGVTETAATLRGEIISLGIGPATERGFYINTSPFLTGATKEGNETGSFNVGVYTHAISSLTEGETYYYIAYAFDNYGEGWGEWVQFTAGGTSGWAVVTLDPDPVGEFEARFWGDITKLAGTYATIRGFEWGYTAVATWDWHQDGNFTLGTYHYTPELDSDQIYYVRAYAGNSTTVDYGLWIGFITKVPAYLDSSDTTSIADIPVPTTAPGGWVRSGKTYDGFPFTELLNSVADLSIGRAFLWFIIEVATIVLLTILSAKYVRHLWITFCILLILFLVPFIAFEYLDWWMFAPFLVVFAALAIKEGQYSWS